MFSENRPLQYSRRLLVWCHITARTHPVTTEALNYRIPPPIFGDLSSKVDRDWFPDFLLRTVVIFMAWLTQRLEILQKVIPRLLSPFVGFVMDVQ